MSKYLLLLLLSTFFSLAKSQEIPWGKISAEEWAIDEVPFEKGAEAVKLKEIGLLKFTDDGYELIEYGRIKILSDTGFENAEKKWSYNATVRNDKVSVQEAQTVNFVEGKEIITPLDKKDIIISRNDDVVEIAVAFPNVKVGSIIEYKVRILRTSNLYASPWRFQNSIPTLSSQLFLQIANVAAYKLILKGEQLNKKYSVNGKKNNKEWKLENIPSDKMYKNVYNVEDYRERVMFQYTSARKYYGSYYSENSWKGFTKLVNEDVKKAKKYADFQNISNQIKNGATKLQTLKNTLQFLRENYQWNRHTAVQSFDLASEFLRKKTGNSADFNVLLNEILKLKNINSELAINSLRSNGRIIVAYPAFSKLQTLVNIVEVDDGEKILIDAATSTPEKVRFPSLDFYNQIVLGLNNAEFMEISPTLSEFVSQQYLTMNKDNSTVKIKNRSRGYFNYGYYKNEVFNVFSGNKISETNEDETNEWKVNQRTLDFDNPPNNLLVIENPFTRKIADLSVNKDRNYPIELDFPFLSTIQLKTKLSENQKILSENFNQNISAFNGNLQYVQQIENSNGEEILTWSFLLKQTIFQNSDIAEYNKFIDQLQVIVAKAAVIQNK